MLPFSYSIYVDTEEMHPKVLSRALILTIFAILSCFICCNCHQETNGDQGWESLVSEDVEVKFVTRVRRKRGLDSQGYHIVEVLRPASNISMKIQLSRNDELLADDFRFFVQDGSAMAGNHTEAETDDRSHCVYSGSVTGTSSDSKSITGEAVLSACHNHEGFTGLITTNQGQFFLQPLPAKAEAYQSFAVSADDGQPNITIHHVLSLVKDGDEGSNVHKCGGSIHAPEYKPVDGQSSEDGNIDQLASGAVPLVEPNSPEIPSPMAQNGPETYKRGAKSKTSSPKSHLVELAVFVDETCLAALEKKLGTKSVKALKSYVITLVQMMSLIYQRPSLKQKVDFKLLRIEFLAKNPSEINTHQGSLVPFLDSFCAYASKVNANGMWDHSMLLTGVDLVEGTFKSPVGVAFTKGLCTKRHACSVVEGTSFAAGTVMAHEMGHSFGMEHDGEKSNGGCDPKAHVMAALVGPNQPTWSTCSNNNMDSFMRKLATTSPNVLEKGYCLQQGSTNEKYYKFSKKLPGESYPADAQCAIQYPDKPKAVTPTIAKKFTGGDMKNMCEMLWCTDASVRLSFTAHPALEGSECAPGKWCRGGKCVKKV